MSKGFFGAPPPTLTLTKLQVARRQLSTAITLWFHDGDPVSIHTLAHAAYEIFHTISKKINPKRSDLLFDSSIVKDEYRGKWSQNLKKAGNFFKHANNDADKTFDFNPELPLAFILFSIAAVEACGEPLNSEEKAFWFYVNFQKSVIIPNELIERIPVNILDDLRGWPKEKFFDMALKALG